MFTRPFLIILLIAACTLAGEPSIKLLPKDEAAVAIVEEKIEPYFKLMTSLEMAAKLRDELPGDTLDAKREECRKRYAAAMKDFTDEEKAIVRVCIARVHPVLEKHYPLIAKTTWSVIKKSDALEAGSHFTRESHMVLSEHVLVRAAKLAADGKEDAAVNTLLPLLLHEQMHVLQRLNPKVFADLYTTQWGYTHAATIKAGDWLDRRQVVNPDGVDVNWILPVKDEAGEKWMWPRVVMTKTEGVPVLFRDMQMVLIELKKETGGAGGFRVKVNDDGAPVSQPMSQSKTFLAAFPLGNAYHPNEAAASALPAVILADLRPENEEKTPAERKAYEEKLRAWMRGHLK